MNSKSASAILIVILSFLSCNNRNQGYETITGFIQGSTYNMIFEKSGQSDPFAIKQNVEKLLHDFDMSLSLYNDSSILSKVNRNEPVVVDSFFTEVFNLSKEISKLTGGLFDVTVGPLVRAWGFGPDERRSFTESKRDSLLKLVGMEKVSLKNGRIIKSNPGIKLDFNAIAQGYSVDVVCRYFDRLKIKTYLVEIGGEVRVKGGKAGKPWKIGVDRPEDNNMQPGKQLQAIIMLKDKALATSGNYRKFYVENGVKYSHHIDPRTGYTTRNQLLSVTILTDQCAKADGIATGCLVMGKDEAVKFIINNKLDGYLIYSDDNGNFQTWISENLKKNISENLEE
jgi:FAD:protein FMN transferase